MQRTRSSPSARHSPLTRHPLGSQGRVALSIAIGLTLLVGGRRVGYSSDAISADEARRELLEREFKIVTKTQEIPEAVLVLFAALTKAKGRVLAEPGTKYQETDVVREAGLPRRRLIFAGNGRGIYFLNYEMGGIGHSQHVAVFEFVPGRITLVWRAVLDRKANDLKDLRDAVRKGQYHDDTPYAF